MFMDKRKPKQLDQKQKYSDNYELNVHESQITKMIEQNVKQLKSNQQTNAIFNQDKFKKNYECYPCLKKRPPAGSGSPQKQNLSDIQARGEKQQDPPANNRFYCSNCFKEISSLDALNQNRRFQANVN